MENVYEICFYGGLILAILLLITAIVLFVVLKIPKAIGDLTGRTAKKAMRDMRDENKAPGSIAKKEQEKYQEENGLVYEIQNQSKDKLVYYRTIEKNCPNHLVSDLLNKLQIRLRRI